MAASAQPGAAQLIAMADADATATVAAILRRGGVVALPTDTVYGFAAAVDRDDAIARLYALKERPSSKAIPVLLSDAEQADQVVRAMPATARVLADAFWPGGLTLVLPARGHLHPHLTSTEDGELTVAVRVPDHAFTRSVIAALGGALAVTSANRSGGLPALQATEIANRGDHAPDAIVDGGRVSGGVSSTIVRVLPGAVAVLRHGAIPDADLEAVLGQRGARTAGDAARLV